jgi:osmotically-inducible protein OsmY
VATIEAAVGGGIVSLRGSVLSVQARRRAEAEARRINGVLGLDNALDVDSAISARVTAALADDPRTRLAVIDAVSERGLVTISGKVDSVEVREAAEEIAAAQPGVVSVINALEVMPDDDTSSLFPAALAKAYAAMQIGNATMQI